MQNNAFCYLKTVKFKVHFSAFYVTCGDISSKYIIHVGNAPCVTRLISTRVTACCLRRKEGELRTFRSYTEEEIFFWVWFNRQEAAETHCSVMLFLWVQDSQVSLWVFFVPDFKMYRWYFWLSLPLHPKQESPVCCTMIKGMLEEENIGPRHACIISAGNMPLTYLNENWPKKKWNLVSGDISELLSLGTLLSFHPWSAGHIILLKLVSNLPKNATLYFMAC